MTLGEKQEAFAALVPRLLDKAHELGFKVRLGETHRSDAQAELNALGTKGRAHLASMIQGGYTTLAAAIRRGGNGIKYSAHRNKLAIDIHLFKDGAYLSQTSDHAALGAWWEQQHPSARWGGHFSDGNHYSFEHDGVK